MKRLIFITITLLHTVNTFAQQGISCKAVFMYSTNALTPLENATASLQLNAESPVIDTKLPLKDSARFVTASQKKQVVKPQDLPMPKMIQSGTVYVVPGEASAKQFTSLQVNMVLEKSCATPDLELYKVDAKNGLRSFSIPAGMNGNTAVIIPITIEPSAELSLGGKPSGSYRKIKPLAGYLQPGEYILIDKSTLSQDGSKIGCVAFSVKQ